MANNLYQYVFDRNLTTRQEVYNFIASQVESQTLRREEIQRKFLERETLGNIEIAKSVVLPHFTDKRIQNKIFIIRLQKPILNWSKDITKVKIVIALVINSQADLEIKSQVQNFMINLANDQFIELIMSGSQSKIKNYLKL